VFVAIWPTIQKAASLYLLQITIPIKAIVTAFEAVVEAVKAVIEWISKIKIPNVGGLLKKLNPFSLTYTPAAPSSPTFVAATRGTSGTFAGSRRSAAASGPTIIIQGAIDPAATARQIRRILRDDSRRRTGVQIGPVLA
jgi:hypothetical protein